MIIYVLIYCQWRYFDHCDLDLNLDASVIDSVEQTSSSLTWFLWACKFYGKIATDV